MRQNEIVLKDDYIETLQSTKVNSTYSIFNLRSQDKGRSWDYVKAIVSRPNNLFAPRVLSVGSEKELFLTEEISNNYKITHVFCDSQFNCDLASYETILTATNNTWDSKGVTSAFPLFSDNVKKVFYTGYDGSTWSLGLATLVNGTWTKCPNRILSNYGDGTYVREKGNLFEIYYHNPFGGSILKRTSPGPIGCTMQWSEPEEVLSGGAAYDEQHMIAPSVIDFDGRTYLFYTGRGSNTWTLNVATDPPIPSLSPTEPPSPSPSPSPTLTPSPSPTPTPNPATTNQVILIPGMFSSWNEEALLHNKSVSPDEWALNPILTEYTGILKTLENIGFVQEQTLFTFTYDWRKPIVQSAQDLKNFVLSRLDPTKRHLIIGHSLGGLVGRAYMQKHHPPNALLTTVGSPHHGIATVYPALAAGEVQTPDMPTWFAQKLLLQIAKKLQPLTPSNVLLQTQLPVLYDLLPTTPYLYNNTNPIVPQTMQLKNTTLPLLDQTLQQYVASLRTTLGTSTDTVGGYKTRQRTLMEQYLNYYPDGAIGPPLVHDGDGLVTVSSAHLPTVEVSLPQRDHRELIYTKDSIASILTTLGIPFTTEMLTAGARTSLRPALIGVMLSPADLSVVHDGTTYKADQGLVYIPNPTSDTYIVKAQGKTKGAYTIILGLTGDTSDTWKILTGSITSASPTAETDIFSVIIDPSKPAISLPSTSTIQSLKEHILKTQNVQTQALVSSALLLLQQAQSKVEQNKPQLAYQDLFNLHHTLFIIRDLTTGQHQWHAKQSITLLHDYASNTLSAKSTKKQLTLRTAQLQNTLDKLIRSGLSFAKLSPPTPLKKDSVSWAKELLDEIPALTASTTTASPMVEWKLHAVQELEYRLP
ncbi:MAG: Lecithin:cholesterol acyltransferase [Microgenomates bacterium OLB22]|nr:MAG: Lecithin:cholesterol acyltransferase [Microgenomates bacterium OLB22]